MANQDKPGTSKRGFASMDEAKQREIARKGGESVPPEQRSFSKDRELAAEAGRKGGEASSRLHKANQAVNPGDGSDQEQ
jgi:general stress protein YciG